MAREFLLPDLGEGIAEAQIVRVLIKAGDAVAEDQYLLEVETDKAAVEIPSPYAGVATDVLVEEGQTVSVGDVMVRFDGVDKGVSPATVEKASKTAAPPALIPAAAPAPVMAAAVADATPGAASPVQPLVRKTTPAAAPAVRKLARDRGIDLSAVVGSGAGGRITREDLERHRAETPEWRGAVPPVVRPTGKSVPHTTGKSVPHTSAPRPGVADTDKWGPIRRVPLSQIRKTIAAQMAQSAATIPHVTHCDEADITELDRMRNSVNKVTGGEPRLTAMSFLIRALCIAIRKYPIFNASFDEKGRQIIYKDYVNIGIAVDTERGLIVPVIRDADQLPLRGIAMALRTIADRIRTGQFTIEDLRGGTFTVTNVGALGGTYTTPIINHPEVAILGLGRSRKVPVVRDDQITAALLLPLSLSFDHRATDGANAARFTREIIDHLETPARFLLDS